MFGMRHINYKFGARWPVEGLDLVEDQLRKTHQFYNSMIELHRKARAFTRAAQLACPDVAAARSELAAAGAEVEIMLAVARGEKDGTGLRCATDDTREAVSSAKARRKAASKAFYAALKQSWKTDHVKSRKRRVAEMVRLGRKRAYANASDTFWPNKNLATDYATQAANTKASPLWKFGQPNDPRFSAYSGEGTIEFQLIRPITPGEALAGSSNGVRIEPSADDDLRISGSRRSQKRQRMVLWLRVGSNGTAPVWAKIPFTMHRPFPEGTVIKRVRLIKRKIGTKVEWSVMFVLSIPEPAPVTGDNGCGFDVGWRNMDDGSIRVGYVAGSDGLSEDIAVPAEIVSGLRKASEIRSVRDVRMEAIRDELAAWLGKQDGLPEWLEDAGRYARQWRSPRRFVRLFRTWVDNRIPGDSAIFAALESWYHRDRHLWQWESCQRSGAQRRRLDYYRNIAARLSERFDWIAHEDLDATTFRREASDEKVDAAKGQRSTIQLVAPMELVGALKNAFEARGKCVVKVDPKHTSKTCHVCGERAEFTEARERMQVCPNGHEWDRDDNAARNILERGRGEVAVPEVTQEQESRWQRVRRIVAERESPTEIGTMPVAQEAQAC